jgi:hypothetical protein
MDSLLTKWLVTWDLRGPGSRLHAAAGFKTVVVQRRIARTPFQRLADYPPQPAASAACGPNRAELPKSLVQFGSALAIATSADARLCSPAIDWAMRAACCNVSAINLGLGGLMGGHRSVVPARCLASRYRRSHPRPPAPPDTATASSRRPVSSVTCDGERRRNHHQVGSRWRLMGHSRASKAGTAGGSASQETKRPYRARQLGAARYLW